ncbi:MAG: hypothetical protein Alis3KO_05520 [Aliiglaciecola sp.]
MHHERDFWATSIYFGHKNRFCGMRSKGTNALQPWHVLRYLKHAPGTVTGGADTDLAELIEYFYEHVANKSILKNVI